MTSDPGSAFQGGTPPTCRVPEPSEDAVLTMVCYALGSVASQVADAVNPRSVTIEVGLSQIRRALNSHGCFDLVVDLYLESGGSARPGQDDFSVAVIDFWLDQLLPRVYSAINNFQAFADRWSS